MRRLRRLGLWIFAASGMALAVDWLPDALAELEFFRARDFRVVGTTTLEEDYVLEVAAIPPFVSIFDDPGPWEERLERHPLVRRVVIEWRLPATLVLTVEERTPVAFVASPVLEPVDRDGHVLPLDPGTHWLDLPLLRAAGAGARELSPSQVRVLATEVERLRAMFRALKSGELELWQIELAEHGGIDVVPAPNPVPVTTAPAANGAKDAKPEKGAAEVKS